MADEDNVIDVEAEEIPDSADNLPAVIPRPKSKDRGTHGSAKPMPQDAAAPSPGRDWSTYSRPERRCTAHSSRTGEQCKNVAIKGHNVCRYHGGAAKQIKRAAQTRLDNAAEVMAKQLLNIALSADSEAVMLAAVKDALDRTIGKAPTTVEIGPTKPYEEVLGDVFGGISPMSREESRRARGLPEEDSYPPAAVYAEGVEGLPPTHGDPDLPTPPPDQQARRESVDLTTYLREGASRSDQADDYASRYEDLRPEYVSREGDSYSQPGGPRQPRPRRFDRQPQPEPPVRHITGDAAFALANEANRAIGALPEQKAITSPHKRYSRP
jgi:hypothetical protein